MDLTPELLAYLDGFSDGYSRGYQDAIVAQATKVRVEVKEDSCKVVSEKRNSSPGLSPASSFSGSSVPQREGS